MTTDFTSTSSTAFSHPGHPPATTTEHRGIRYLHLGTKWVQGAMRLDKPDAIELEYVQMMMMWMLFKTQPKRLVQLGLGSAALTKFSYRRFPDAAVTAVELNPNVIAICGAQFALPPNDARLDVREMNALDFVRDKSNHGTVDVLQVDLYDEDARGPVLDTPEFYQACFDCLTDDGIMCTNVFGTHGHDQGVEGFHRQCSRHGAQPAVWVLEVFSARVSGVQRRSPIINTSFSLAVVAGSRRNWHSNWLR